MNNGRTQNNDKTEHQLYVSGFNCIPQNAYEIMMETKTRWRKPVKDGNILAYHIIQSFAPGEATPDQVHQIGCEFVQRFLADRFECTVSTHLDRGHLHNHIVVNSVSYADGRMFRSDFNTYYKGIRETSDELCRENRLSVIETDGKGKSYDEWLSGQAGKPTIRGMVRKDVEQAIAAADSFDGFITELQNMGYTVKYGPRVEHMAVRHKDAQRNIRIDRLDPRFSETALREYYRQLHRMPTEMQQEYRQENAPAKPKWQPTELQPTVRRARYLGKLPRRYPKVSGFMACYYHYCALLRKAYHGKSTKRCYFLLREDFLLFSRYQQQTKFLWENHTTKVTDRKIKRLYLVAATVVAAAFVMAMPAFADDPLTTINNLSDFVFSAIKAIGAILLGFGIVQIGLALKGHDASQRAQGFMTFFGGVVIYFAKDILDMIL